MKKSLIIVVLALMTSMAMAQTDEDKAEFYKIGVNLRPSASKNMVKIKLEE